MLLQFQKVGIQKIFFFPLRIPLSLVLLIALINGLLFVFIVPPWQHYDEPGHFEYSWLLTKRSWPITEDTVDPQLRSEILSSMTRFDFFKGLSDPAWIIVPQFVDPPLYHFIASIPLRLFPATDVTTQMYLMRLVSLGFFLLSVLAAWGTTRQISLPNSVLIWMVPLFLALLPSLADMMTAINNDSAAIAFASLFVWFAVRCVRQRGKWLNVLLLILVTVLAFFTKKTAWFLVLFLPFVLILSFVPSSKRLVVWGGTVALVIIVLVVSFEMGDAGDWSRVTNQQEYTRINTTPLVGYDHAIQVVAEPGFAEAPSVWQHLPVQSTNNIKGKTITLGGWMWSSRPTMAATPGILFFVGNQVVHSYASKHIEITSQPKFFQFEIQVPKDTGRAIVGIVPFSTPPPEKIGVYYTGLFMVDGRCSSEQVPLFSDSFEDDIQWCDISYENLIRNESAEKEWPVLRNEVVQFLGKWVSINRSAPSAVEGYFLDRQGSQWYDQAVINNLFRSFWAIFGWGHVPLLGSKPYRLLFIVTVFMILGGIAALVMERNALLRKDTSLILVVLLLGLTGWLIGLLSGIYFSGLTNRVVIPVARFAYTAIVPTAFFLVVGWWEWFGLLGRKFRPLQNAGLYLFVLLFIGLDIYALFSILYYYHWA